MSRPRPGPAAAPAPSVVLSVLTAAAATIAVTLAAPVAAAVARTAVVDLGGTRGYVRADQSMPLAGVELFVRAGLDRETPAQNGLAALVAEAVLQTPTSPAAGAGAAVPLADAVNERGGSISYAVGTQSVRFYLEGTPETLAAVAPLVARALAAPAFEAATLAAARAALADRVSDEEADPRLVGRAMLRSSYYRGGAGLPALGSATALASLAPADARSFYQTFYRRGDAVVAAVGRTGDATDAASRALVASLPPGAAPAATLATRPFAAQPKRIVTHRDVGAPYVVLGFAAPALGDRDFAAALVLRSLLSGVFDRAGAMTPSPLLRPAGTFYGYDAAPAQLVLWINGARVRSGGRSRRRIRRRESRLHQAAGARGPEPLQGDRPRRMDARDAVARRARVRDRQRRHARPRRGRVRRCRRRDRARDRRRRPARRQEVLPEVRRRARHPESER